MSQVCPHTWISLDDYSSLLIVFLVFPPASLESNFLFPAIMILLKQSSDHFTLLLKTQEVILLLPE